MIHPTPGSSLSIAALAVLIPARRYEPALTLLVDALLAAGLGAIILVDDGSPAEDRPFFNALAAKERVLLTRHAVNLGKGRALKTGINLFLDFFSDFLGLITADADGQHTASDIVRIGEALLAHPQRAVLGSRSFAGAVPLRSRLGNALTRQVFRFASGEAIHDTQSGLRGFPTAQLADLLTLDGERYEYEMTVLAHLCRNGLAPREVTIATVYIDDNRSSHFDPVRDSMRIYFVLLRYYAASLLSAVLDFGLFAIVYSMTHSILASLVAGRMSSLANYLLNRRFVFKHGSALNAALPRRGSTWRYALLVLVIATLSYGGIRGLAINLQWNVLAAKSVVDSLLSLASFAAQRAFVFPVKEDR